jgi:addiction module RelE/StbE family toxin
MLYYNFDMWTVVEDRGVAKSIAKIPAEILEAYEFWKNVARISGPMGIRTFPGFKDYSLKGEWEGARSSCLNKKWRVIYSVIGSKVSICVLEVTPHDCRKKS